MENTGRLLQGPAQLARRILFGTRADASIDAELKFITNVNKAHLLMLTECGLVERSSACENIRVINELQGSDFAPLRSRAAPRGLYLLYENYLIERLGAQIGGILQTARSRNDLNATVLKMRLRGPLLRLLGESLRLQAVVLRRSRRYSAVTMPIHTHYQAAVPITYGHYLAGVGCALNRDIAGLMAAIDDINRCPLGAGAVGGTSLPINPGRTASLLGFERPIHNSVDAVASRDLVLRLLSGAAILGVTLSRAASDLLMWTSRGYTSATELANRLVVEGGMAFRTAHHAVGSLIRLAIESGAEDLQEALADCQEAKGTLISPEMLDPASVAQATVYGGGPSHESLMASLQVLCSDWASHMRMKREQARKWCDAEVSLNEIALEMCSADLNA